MKLTHPDVHFDIEFGKDDSLIPVCVVESPVRWREIQKELMSQQSGDSGNWVLSEGDKELKISKVMEMIFNPLQLDVNQRKLVTAFLKSFAEKAVNEMHWREGQELNTHIQTFFGNLEVEYSFEFSINEELDYSSLAKAMGIQLVTEYETDMERLLQYCILLQELIKPKLLIFWNLRQYFSAEEMKLLYSEVCCREWNVLLMEHYIDSRIDGEKWYIIDKDNCEIY